MFVISIAAAFHDFSITTNITRPILLVINICIKMRKYDTIHKRLITNEINNSKMSVFKERSKRKTIFVR